jgi:hypothetical protein
MNDMAQLNGLPAVPDRIQVALKPSHILDEVYAYIGRFIAYPNEHARVAHTLWIGHAHFMEAWDSTPRIAFLSPESGSGKTRALEVTETLVPRPIEAVNATPAYLFRKVSDPDGLPTILFDEIDTIFGAKAREHEEIRGVINAGHRRGATAGRCVIKGKSVETEEFPAFCAVAMAGLGKLPDTIMTRSVCINMRRRALNEPIEPYRRRRHAPEGYALRDRLAEWADSVRNTISVDPSMPDGVTDRHADVWEALLAVADATGGDWPTRARVSAVTFVTDASGAVPSLGIRLLSDLRSVFGDREAVPTADLLADLIALDESPWGDLKGKALDARRMARLLHPYDVSSKTIRIGNGTVKGYTRESLSDAWTRYLSLEKPTFQERLSSATKVTRETEVTPEEESEESQGAPVSSESSVTTVTGETAEADELIIEEDDDVA